MCRGSGWRIKKTKDYMCFGWMCCAGARMKNSVEEYKEVHIGTVPFVIDGFICQTSMKTFKNYLDI